MPLDVVDGQLAQPEREDQEDAPLWAQRHRPLAVGDVVLVNFQLGGKRRGKIERLNPKRLHVRLFSDDSLVERRRGDVEQV